MMKIAIVEDHNLLRTSFINLINEEDDYSVVIDAENGEEFLKKINPKNLPDVILVDVEMPIMDGPTTVVEIRKKYGEDIKIMGLSVHKEVRLVQEMLKCGANGYISKSASADELFMAIKSVMATGYYLSKDIAEIINLSESFQYKEDTLSFLEEDILKLVCEEKTNKEIAEKLRLSVNTVNTYRTRMLEKLGVRNSVGLVLYAIKLGIYKIK